MTLVSFAAYQRLTGDSTTDEVDVTAAVADAQKLVEEYLRRPIESDERTERVRLYPVDGDLVAFPSATPITEVPDGHTVVGAGVIGGVPTGFGVWADGAETRWTTLTYTGGWTEDTVPLTVQREIARLARQLVAGAASAPESEVNVEGDADLGTPPVVPVLTVDGLAAVDTAALRGYRRRRAS